MAQNLRITLKTSDSVTIGIDLSRVYEQPSIQYRILDTDNQVIQDWTEYEEYGQIALNPGFSCEVINDLGYFTLDTQSYITFTCDSYDAEFAVSGYLGSLLYGDQGEGTPSYDEAPGSSFYRLFSSFPVTDASGLLLYFSSYGTYSMANMFEDCSRLEYGPTIPDTYSIDMYAFAEFFKNCGNLKYVDWMLTHNEYAQQDNQFHDFLDGAGYDGSKIITFDESQYLGDLTIPYNWEVKQVDYVKLTDTFGHGGFSDTDITVSYYSDRLQYNDGYGWRYFGSTTVRIYDAKYILLRATEYQHPFTYFNIGTTYFNVSGSLYTLYDWTASADDMFYQQLEASYLFCNSYVRDASKLKFFESPYTLYRNMFQNSHILTPPESLPSEMDTSSMFEYMFCDCGSLTKAPELPSMHLFEYCYSYMFQNCTSLVQAPDLPAVVLADNCYRGMFDGCSSLNQITYGSASAAQQTEWMRNVSSTGTFYYTSSVLKVSDFPRNANGIPEGWRIEFKGEGMKKSFMLGGKMIDVISIMSKPVKTLNINGRVVYEAAVEKNILGYTSNGLLCMLDGINNAGLDQEHSTGAQSWVNLCETGSMFDAYMQTYRQSGWGSNCYSLRGNLRSRPYIGGYLMRDWMKGEWTVQMYVSIATSSQYDNYRGFFGGHHSIGGRGIVGGQYEDGTWVFALYSPSLDVWKGQRSEMPEVGRKFLITMTSSMSKGRIRVFIDDDEKGSIASTDAPLNYSYNEQFLLGAANHDANRVGYLDIYSVRIYGRALEDSEITKSLQNDRTRFV